MKGRLGGQREFTHSGGEGGLQVLLTDTRGRCGRPYSVCLACSDALSNQDEGEVTGVGRTVAKRC